METVASGSGLAREAGMISFSQGGYKPHLIIILYKRSIKKAYLGKLLVKL